MILVAKVYVHIFQCIFSLFSCKKGEVISFAGLEKVTAHLTSSQEGIMTQQALQWPVTEITSARLRTIHFTPCCQTAAEKFFPRRDCKTIYTPDTSLGEVLCHLFSFSCFSSRTARWPTPKSSLLPVSGELTHTKHPLKPDLHSAMWAHF